MARPYDPADQMENAMGKPISEGLSLIQSKRELGNNGGAAPTGGQTFGVCDRINAAARMCVRVASQDEAISLREIGVIIA
jgi:hypothetical protein